MTSHDLTRVGTLPAAPTTQRAVPVRIDAFENTIAYGSGSCVIARRVGRDSGSGGGDDVLVCALHKAPVTAVRFSPNGAFIASGDQTGCLVVFANREGTAEKLRCPLLQGAVRDIAWTGDGERLVVVGEGKIVLGVAISATGNSIGSINGHTRPILSCDMRRDRPFRAFTGSTDSFVGLYEGVPFVFKKNTQGHSGSVNCVRYSAAVDEVATCSSSSAIIVFDGTTGEKKREIPSGHTGTVYALSWSPDGLSLATASADKHVHILNAADGNVRHKVCFGTAVTDMQQGIVWTLSAGIFAVSACGTLTAIHDQTGSIAATHAGHQGRICLLHLCDNTGDLLSVSVEGKLIRWRGRAGWSTNTLIPLPPSADDVVNAATVCENSLYVVAGNLVLVYDAADATGAGVRVLSQNAGGFSPAVVAMAGGKVALVSRSKVVVLSQTGDICGEAALPPQLRASTAVAAGNGPGGGTLLLVGGDRCVTAYEVSAAGAVTATGTAFEGRHTGAVSCLAVSADGDRVASVDSASRNVFVWSPRTGEALLSSSMCHHTAAVTCMAFHPTDANELLSGALDCTVIAWDLAGNKRKMEDAAHRSGVSAVAWGKKAGADLVSSGGDYCIRCWSLSK